MRGRRGSGRWFATACWRRWRRSSWSRPGHPGLGSSRGSVDDSDADRVAFWLGLTLVALVAAGAWFARELLRAQGRLMLRVEELEGTPSHSLGLPVGTPAPSFSVRAHRGGELSSRACSRSANRYCLRSATSSVGCAMRSYRSSNGRSTTCGGA